MWGTGDSVSLRGDLNLSPSNLGPDEYIVALDGRMPHWLGGPFDLKANATRQQSERSIDEFSIHVIPVMIGEGIPLVAPRHRNIPLGLISARSFPDGVVHLNYTVRP